MKQISEMSREELLEYFVQKKVNGASYQAMVNICTKNNIDDETRKYIMNSLDEIDKEQKKASNKEEKVAKIKKGIVSLITGSALIIFGIILYFTTARVGVVFILNFVVWGIGALLVLRGILNIIAEGARRN